MALTDSLISHWKLDEASGNALDAHGANELTETSGTIDSATGKINNARDYESGDTEYHGKADNADLSVGDIDFTIAFWCKPENLSGLNATIVGKYLTTGNQRAYQLGYATTPARFQFTVSPDGSATTVVSADSLGAPSNGNWYFIVAWHDASANTINVQVNNGTVDSVSHTTGVFDNTAAFTIGARDGATQPWDGLIDECGFWKRVLTSDERTALYNSGNGLAYPFGVAFKSAWAKGSNILISPGVF